ncbi:hypothetical protein GCM10023322_55630 [Rugosimonospora acidiphila]|uniref:Uncharacterized protein n=1 Tax=Rugosimonospora acidiphila TaxID=556531 RepID=A0ABP9SDM6_9ACTN
MRFNSCRRIGLRGAGVDHVRQPCTSNTYRVRSCARPVHTLVEQGGVHLGRGGIGELWAVRHSQYPVAFGQAQRVGRPRPYKTSCICIRQVRGALADLAGGVSESGLTDAGHA